ncbi:solute carrier family 23 protein [Cupriavidus basilensis]
MIAAGVFGILVAPLMGRMLGLFPPVVTGTVITLIGVSLMRVGINWAAGGQPTTRAVIDGVVKDVPNLAYGDLGNLGIAALVLVAILLLSKYGRGLISNCAVLLGIVIGTLVAMALGKVSFEGLDEASLDRGHHPAALRHSQVRRCRHPVDVRGDADHPGRIHRHVPRAGRYHRQAPVQ